MVGCLSSVLSWLSRGHYGYIKVEVEDAQSQYGHQLLGIISPTRPHRALGIDDILSLIFEAVLFGTASYDESHAQLGDRRTVARAARVCKAFNAPALRVLWRVLDNVLPLVRILSCIQIPRDGGHRSVHAQTLQDDMNPRDWTRFQMYAKWPRRVMDFQCRGQLHPSVLIALHGYNGGNPLVPALRNLSWTLHEQSDVESLFALVPFSLTDLEIVVGDKSLSSGQVNGELNGELSTLCVGTFLRQLPKRLPHLETLSMREVTDIVSIIPVGEITSLLRLSITVSRPYTPRPVLDRWTMVGIAAAPNLRALELALNLSIEDNFVSHEVYFPLLQSLALTGHSSELAAFLDKISCPMLTSLDFKEIRGSHTSQFYDILSTTRTLWANTLEHIAIFATYWARGAQAQGSVSLTSIIGPILDMPLLRKVTILCRRRCLVSLTDQHICDIARAWPRLESLTIEFHRSHTRASSRTDHSCHTHTSLPTLHSYSYFVQHCPHLVSLTLPGLDTTIQDDTEMPQYDHHIRYLRVICCRHDWKGAEVPAIAERIYRLFPHINFEYYVRNCQFDDGWHCIMEKYGVIAKAASTTRNTGMRSSSATRVKHPWWHVTP